MNDGLNMAFAPENIESSHDVFVSLFGELKIYTSHGILREADLKSPKISRLLTYLLISGKKAHSSLEIAQALWPDDSTNPAKNMRNLIYRLRQTFGLAKLRQVDAFTIFRLARTAGVSLPGKTKYLQQVYTIYNGGSRRAALPLKF